MTRKRFKKLCMGLGFSRSMADNAAFTTWFCFGNYAEGWRLMEATVADVNRARLATGGDPSTPADASAQDDRGGANQRGDDGIAPYAGDEMREGVSVCE